MRGMKHLDRASCTVGDRRPRLVAVDPLAQPACLEVVEVCLGCERCFEQGSGRDASRIFPKLLLQHVAGGTPDQRFPHRRVVSKMLARCDVDKASTGHGLRGTGHSEDEAVVHGSRDWTFEIQLDPAPGTSWEIVSLEHDHPGADFDGSCVEKELGTVYHRL